MSGPLADRPTRAGSRRDPLGKLARVKRLCVLAICLLALACGKKGDPQPPLPRGPNAVKDLAVEQEGDDAVLTFSFPDRLQTGAPLTDLESDRGVSASSIRPRGSRRRAGPAPPPGRAPAASGAELRGAGSRRAARGDERAARRGGLLPRLRARRRAFPAGDRRGDARRVGRLPRPAQLRCFCRRRRPHPLAYAVVSVRSGGERSPLSNIVSFTPGVAPQAPELLPAILDEGRVCLEWSAPRAERALPAGRDRRLPRLPPPAVAGRVRSPARTRTRSPETSFVDRTAPYGVPLAYTVRATLAKNPQGRGAAGRRARRGLRATRIRRPPRTRVDALSEPNLVRLLWDPVDAADLAGYLVDRAEGGGAPVRLTPAPVVDPFFNDTGRSRRGSIPLHRPLGRPCRQREQPLPEGRRRALLRGSRRRDRSLALRLHSRSHAPAQSLRQDGRRRKRLPRFRGGRPPADRRGPDSASPWSAGAASRSGPTARCFSRPTGRGGSGSTTSTRTGEPRPSAPTGPAAPPATRSATSSPPARASCSRPAGGRSRPTSRATS